MSKRPFWRSSTVRLAIHKLQAEHDLTDIARTMQALLELPGRAWRYMLRYERHGDGTERLLRACEMGMTADELRGLIVARRDLPSRRPMQPGAAGLGPLSTSSPAGAHGQRRLCPHVPRVRLEPGLTVGVGSSQCWNRLRTGRRSIAANDPATVIRNCDEDLAELSRYQRRLRGAI
ncbi:MAG: hypothetical protein WKF82_12440 [Nocardioidaceae bacterium]